MANGTVSPLWMARLEIATRPARLFSPKRRLGVYRQRQFVDPADAEYGFVH